MNHLRCFHLRDTAETEQLGEVLGDLLRSVDAHPGAITLLLSGDLGAGKTTLVRGVARGLGADDTAVASPTFTLRMDHRGESRALAHIDAWRLGPNDGPNGGPHDLESIGMDELLQQSAVIAVEWPEKLGARLPSRHLRVTLDYTQAAGIDAQLHELGRIATIDASALGAREAKRIAEGLDLLVRSPSIAPLLCPVCGASTTSRSEDNSGGVLPFCSQRCRMADLGDWLAMRHRIAGSSTPEFDES